MLDVILELRQLRIQQKEKAGLKNLAERGSCIEVNERKERRIYRAMDRSRRAMNPDNYNEDGTIKKKERRSGHTQIAIRN